MTEPTDYERGLRDGVEIGRGNRRRNAVMEACWWVFLLLSGALVGLAAAL
jgi:hypothetical protein